MQILGVPLNSCERDKIAYLSHPYTASTLEEVEANVMRSIKLQNQLLDLNIQVFNPLVHSHAVHLQKNRLDSFWYKLDAAIAVRCDALILCPGWEASKGCMYEKGLFEGMGKPTFTFAEFVEGIRKCSADDKRIGVT